MKPPADRVGSGRRLALADGRTTRVWEFGSPDTGPPALFLHGWNVDGPTNFGSATAKLAKQQHGYLVDLAGHGRGPRGGRFSFDRVAADVLSAANALHLDEFVLVGYSLGGAVAQRVVHAAPHRCVGLVLCSSAPRFSSTRRERTQFRIFQPSAAALQKLPSRHQDRLFRSIASVACMRYPDWVLPHVLLGDPVSLLEAGSALGSFDGSVGLLAWKGPSAVLVTERDRIVSPSRQRSFAEFLDDPLFVTIDADHDIPVRDDPRFGEALAQALSHIASQIAGPPDLGTSN